MYEIIPVYRLDGSIGYYNIQESYDEETVVFCRANEKAGRSYIDNIE